MGLNTKQVYNTDVIIPENLDLEMIVQIHPPGFKYKLENFKYVVSLITLIPAYNKDILDSCHFVPINAELLQSKVRNYKQYIDYLVCYGIIETDNHYIVGEKSKGFRFTPEYQKPIRIEQSETKLKRNNMNVNIYDIEMQKKYEYLYKWFNPKLSIDFEKAQNFLQRELENNSKHGIYKAIRKFNCGYLNCFRISKGDFYFHIDTNIHRLHTPLTNIKKELRNFITYDGMKLVAVDIKNSQPLIGGVLLDENFYSTSFSGKKSDISFNCTTISKDITTYFYSYSSLLPSSFSSFIMLCKNAKTDECQGFDKYIEQVENGTLYEYIQDELKEKCQIIIRDRKELKSIIFATLFTDNRFLGQKKAEPKRIFKQLFPSVYDVFAKIKQKDKKKLPRILQLIETKLMLDIIAKRIADEYPNMPIFTIHDSIVCPVGNENYVASVIKDEMQKAIGMNPKVSFEYWSYCQSSS